MGVYMDISHCMCRILMDRENLLEEEKKRRKHEHLAVA